MTDSLIVLCSASPANVIPVLETVDSKLAKPPGVD
jgi:hypothetical protein